MWRNFQFVNHTRVASAAFLRPVLVANVHTYSRDCCNRLQQEITSLRRESERDQPTVDKLQNKVQQYFLCTSFFALHLQDICIKNHMPMKGAQTIVSKLFLLLSSPDGRNQHEKLPYGYLASLSAPNDRRRLFPANRAGGVESFG